MCGTLVLGKQTRDHRVGYCLPSLLHGPIYFSNNAAGRSPTPWSLWPLMLCALDLRPQIAQMLFSKAETPSGSSTGQGS